MEDYKFTNRAFIDTLLEADDITKALRVWERYLKNHSNRYAPIWVKEALYEEWLELPFDQKAWDDAGVSRSLPGSIPKTYTSQIKRFINPMKEAGRKIREEHKRCKGRTTRSRSDDEPVVREYTPYEFSELTVRYMNGGVQIVPKKN